MPGEAALTALATKTSEAGHGLAERHAAGSGEGIKEDNTPRRERSALILLELRTLSQEGNISGSQLSRSETIESAGSVSSAIQLEPPPQLQPRHVLVPHQPMQLQMQQQPQSQQLQAQPRPQVSRHPVQAHQYQTEELPLATILNHQQNNQTAKQRRQQADQRPKQLCRAATLPAPSSKPVKPVKGESTAQASGVEGCNCRKSKCLKLYCQCFAAQSVCTDICNCHSCHNLAGYEAQRVAAVRAIRERNPIAFDTKFKSDSQSGKGTLVHKIGCRCRKSACLKKYCECFSQGTRCSSSCTCTGCKNPPLASRSAAPTRPVKRAKTLEYFPPSAMRAPVMQVQAQPPLPVPVSVPARTAQPGNGNGKKKDCVIMQAADALAWLKTASPSKNKGQGEGEKYSPAIEAPVAGTNHIRLAPQPQGFGTGFGAPTSLSGESTLSRHLQQLSAHQMLLPGIVHGGNHLRMPVALASNGAQAPMEEDNPAHPSHDTRLGSGWEMGTVHESGIKPSSQGDGSSGKERVEAKGGSINSLHEAIRA